MLKPCKNQCGATSIEYAVIAILVAIVVIGGINAVGTQTEKQYNSVANAVSR